MDLTRARARAIGAAAATWRRGSGTCPTAKQLSERFSFDRDTELDAWGHPFAIECTDDAIKVVTLGARGDAAEVAHAEPFTPAPAASPTALGRPDVGPQEPPQPADVAARKALATRMKACFQKALADDPSTNGDFDVTVVVAPDGTVKRAVPTASQPAATLRFSTCIANAIKPMKYPPTGEKADKTIRLTNGNAGAP